MAFLSLQSRAKLAHKALTTRARNQASSEINRAFGAICQRYLEEFYMHEKKNASPSEDAHK